MKAPFRLGRELEAQEPLAGCVDMIERLDGMNSEGGSRKMKMGRMWRMGSALLERICPRVGVRGLRREEALPSQTQCEIWGGLRSQRPWLRGRAGPMKFVSQGRWSWGCDAGHWEPE
ncbi:MAG: hypothetical protein DBX00_11135 [Verrucomicrobia bacterium]|nr:MAG: hypothetical protein DBX00_11135 [Verrucomicrobiota bacterium]RPF90910.1 MAG: hypothetical protein CBB78_004655 [Roseibacillus sp. TMED18]